MRSLLALSLLAIGCASAPPPEPRVVERVVYVNAPCPAPVIVEHRGPRTEPYVAPRPRPNAWWPPHAMKRREQPRAERHERHRAERHKHAKREKLMRLCADKKKAEARERCRRNVARR
jgi:hypothetical protein